MHSILAQAFVLTCLSLAFTTTVLPTVLSAPISNSHASFSAATDILASPASRTRPLQIQPTKRQAPTIIPAMLDSAPVKPVAINLSPDLPPIPNVFVPLVVHVDNTIRPPPIAIITSSPTPRPSSIPPPLSGSPYGLPFPGSTNQPNPQQGSPFFQELLETCRQERAPSLSETFAPEVGVVRLFSKRLYQSEIAVLKGCGCITMNAPTVVESFVGSRNHSFALYTNDDCTGEPYYQRFKQQYDVQPARVTGSIRIVLGILPVVPALKT